MTAVAPEPDYEPSLLDADVEAAIEPRRNGASEETPTLANDNSEKPTKKTPGGGKPRGVSRYVPTDPEPYSYEDLLAGQRDPNIPGPAVNAAARPDNAKANLTPAPIAHMHKAPSTTKKYAHRASIGHDGRVMEVRARDVQTAMGRPKVKSIFHSMAGFSKFGEDGSAMHPKLVAVDIDAYGEEWTFVERRNVALYVFLQVR